MLSKLEIIRDQDYVYSLGYLANGDLVYCLKESFKNNGLGAIFNAKIERINYNNKLAFITYQHNRNGIINLERKGVGYQPGSYLTCQMTWLGDENKLPKLTLELKLVGRFVILIPKDSNHHYSKDLIHSERLEPISKKYKHLGLIFRSEINNLADLSLVSEEIDFFVNELDKINKANKNNIGQITRTNYTFMQLLENAQYTDNLQIATNDKEILNYLEPYLRLWLIKDIYLLESLSPNSLPKINNCVTSKQGIELEVSQLSGINLIDVNSDKDMKLTFYQVNYLAIEEIVRQIWLRDLTGIILVDFIKNMQLLDQTKIIKKLMAVLKDDFRKVKVLGFTKAGICEIIRKK